MVEIVDINDRESLEAWLKTQPQKVSVAIAHRAAMRVMPYNWRWVSLEYNANKHNKLSLSVFQYGLISEILSIRSIPEVSEKFDFFEVYADAENADFYSAAAIAFAAAAGVTSAASFAFAAADAAFASATDDASIWNIIKTDCLKVFEEGSLEGMKLWLEFDNSNLEEWRHFKENLASDPVDWSFWIKWYEASLAGEPLNWEMLKDIALIAPKDWELGPKHVNKIIAGIEAEYEDVRPEFPVTPEQMLSRNASVIEAQLDALVLLVTEEMRRISGINDYSVAEGAQFSARISVLESIIAAVEKIRAALANDTSTALAVIDEQLPQVLEGAEKLAEQDETSGISAPIISMGATIKYLTDCNMPGILASGVAALEVVGKPVVGLFKKKT